MAVHYPGSTSNRRRPIFKKLPIQSKDRTLDAIFQTGKKPMSTAAQEQSNDGLTQALLNELRKMNAAIEKLSSQQSNATQIKVEIPANGDVEVPQSRSFLNRIKKPVFGLAILAGVGVAGYYTYEYYNSK